MLIGLSLSFCISDIIHGFVNRDDVAYIICGTRIRNGNEFSDVMENYSRFYWDENPELAREIATDLYNRGLLLQPRLTGGEPPVVYNGHWAKVGREE